MVVKHGLLIFEIKKKVFGRKVKLKQSRHRPRGFQEVQAPRFRDNGTGW